MDYREHTEVASLGNLRGRDDISTLNLSKYIFIEHDIVKFSPHMLEPNLTFSLFSYQTNVFIKLTVYQVIVF